MKVLAIDHGTRLGYAVIENGLLLKCGFKKIKDSKYCDGARFEDLRSTVATLITENNPDIVALEEPKDRTNGNTSKLLIGFYIMALHSAYVSGKKIEEVNPKRMKKIITGNGNADKDMVSEAIAKLLSVNIDSIRPYDLYKVGDKKGQIKCYYYDETDACALAYYTWQKRRKVV